MSIEKYVATHLRAIKPYSTARDEYSGSAQVFLDANESPYETGLNRYPDPYCTSLKKKIAKVKNISEQNIFLGNGSDEAIDLLIRLFCEAQNDSLIITPPTYGMYAVQAAINNVQVKRSYLREDFSINVEDILAKQPAKILFLCSPNNPSGNCLKIESIKELLQKFDGIVVVDQAYADFSLEQSALELISEYQNLVVLQTFSKAWGLAGARLGMAVATSRIIELLNRIKPPYNINRLTQDLVFEKLSSIAEINQNIKKIVAERERLERELSELTEVQKVFPSGANFLLVRFRDAKLMFRHLLSKGIVVRDRSNEPLCENCLRITVGTRDENDQLLKEIKEYEK